MGLYKDYNGGNIECILIGGRLRDIQKHTFQITTSNLEFTNISLKPIRRVHRCVIDIVDRNRIIVLVNVHHLIIEFRQRRLLVRDVFIKELKIQSFQQKSRLFSVIWICRNVATRLVMEKQCAKARQHSSTIPTSPISTYYFAQSRRFQIITLSGNIITARSNFISNTPSNVKNKQTLEIKTKENHNQTKKKKKLINLQNHAVPELLLHSKWPTETGRNSVRSRISYRK